MYSFNERIEVNPAGCHGKPVVGEIVRAYPNYNTLQSFLKNPTT